MRGLPICWSILAAIFAAVAMYVRTTNPRWSAFAVGIAVWTALIAVMLMVEMTGCYR